MSPQHRTPPDTTAQVWLAPTEIAVTPDVNPDTCTGVVVDVVEPFPSWPLLLSPQHRAPPDTTAHEWSTPAEITVTPDVNPDTCVGTADDVVEPVPIRPEPFEPQHCAAPEVVTPHVCVPPAEITPTTASMGSALAARLSAVATTA